MKTIDFDFLLKKVDGTITDFHCGRELALHLSQSPSSKDALKQFELAKKIHKDGKISLETSDFSFLKEAVNEIQGMTVFFKAQILEAIANAKEGKEK